MNDFLILLTVYSTDAPVLVNPDHIVFVRESSDGRGTQVVTSPINDGLVMPIVKESLEEIFKLIQQARSDREEIKEE